MIKLSLSVEVLKLIDTAFWANEQQVTNKQTNNAIPFFDMIIKIQVLFLNCKTASEKIYYFCAMETNLLQTNISYLKGVGPKKAEVLKKELGVYTYQDMLNQFPFRYIDRSQIQKVAYVNDDSVYYQLVGTISNIKLIGAPRATRATGVFSDETGSIEVVWFSGLKWLKNRFKPGVKYVLFGKASEFNHNFNFVHPEIEEYDPKDPLIGEGLQGVYNTTEKMKDYGLGTRTIAKLQKLVL